jgi:hypothetical protein
MDSCNLFVARLHAGIVTSDSFHPVRLPMGCARLRPVICAVCVWVGGAEIQDDAMFL